MLQQIKKPVAIFLGVLLVLFAGFFLITKLPIKMYPSMIKPGFRLNFGHSEINTPEEIYKTYGKEIEDQIKNLKGIEELKTIYYSKWTNFKIDCKWDVDEDEIKQKLENILKSYESTSERKFWFNLNSYSEQSSSNMMVAISSKILPTEELKVFLENNLISRLKKIEDIKNVNFWGWSNKKYNIEIDRDKLLNFHLTIDQISNIIKEEIKTVSLGQISTNSNFNGIDISLVSKVNSLNDLLDINLIEDISKNLNIKLKDIAKISTTIEEEQNLYRLNGNQANFLNINIEPNGDVKRTCNKIEAELEKFKNSNAGIHFNILVNPSIFVQNAINNLILNALIGGVIAILIIFLFLGSIKNTIVIAISIPFCILASFIFMKIFNVSINIISLGGLAIGVGMIVDSSIVSLENIYRKLYENKFETIHEKSIMIMSAVKEVYVPIIASSLTSIVVFFPIIFTASYTKAILGDLSKAVIFILFISIFASILIVPSLSGKYISLKESIKFKKDYFGKIKIYYLNILNWLLEKKTRSYVLLTATTILFLLTLLLLPFIKKEIIAKPVTKLVDIEINLPENENLDFLKEQIDPLEKFLKKNKSIINISTYFWSPQFGFITAELKNRHEFENLKKIINENFPSTPDIRYNVMNWDPGKMPLPRERDIVIDIKGASNSELTNFSDKVLSMQNDFKSTLFREPWVSKEDGLIFEFKKGIIKKNEIKDYISTSLKKGKYITNFIEDGETKYLSLSFLPHQIIKYPEDLKNLPIYYENKIIPLKAIAKIKLENGSYIPLMFVNGVRKQEIVFSFNDDVKNKNEQVELIKNKISKIEKPIDLIFDYANPNKEISASINSFKTSLAISILLVFFIIVIIFNSIKYPLIILSSVPFSLIGVIWGLFITKSTISLNSMLGIILLCGLVVNNAILLVDFYLRKKENLQNSISSIIDACLMRIRPILMTTLTTLFAVLPIALAFGESSEILQPLGISIFFGLLVSTVLTLFIIPCFIRIIDFK